MANAGFTLIELLVVIAIIGILVGASFFGLQGIFESSRDTQRKSDLKQYQTALENYANKNNGFYMAYTGGTDLSGTVCGDLGLANCPEDPIYDSSTGEPKYGYLSDTNAANYVMWAVLEDTANGSYWVVCSNGKSGNSNSTSLATCDTL